MGCNKELTTNPEGHPEGYIGWALCAWIVSRRTTGL